MSLKRLLVAAVLSAASPLLTACGGAPKVQIGPDHFYKKMMNAEAVSLAGTYRVTGSFAQGSSDGQSIVIEQGLEQGRKSSAVAVKRLAADGTLQAVGAGTVIGDQLYVAWQMGAADKLSAGPMMVELYVFDLKASAFEGFGYSAMYSPLSGDYAGKPSAAKLPVRGEATYHFVQQAYGEPDRKFDLDLQRYDEQLRTTISAPGRTTYYGTSLLGGDTRLAAAVLSENQRDIPELAVGVYTVANGSIAGRSAFMANRLRREEGEMDMIDTMKLPSTTEQWNLDAAPAAAAAGGAQ